MMKKIDKLVLLIDEYCHLTEPLLDKEEKIDRKENFKRFIEILFLERFYYNLLAISPLLKLYKKDQNYKFPLGLLLRTGISDFLTFHYFILKSKEYLPTGNLAEVEIRQFLVGGLHYLERDLENELSSGKITKQFYEEVRASLRKMYEEFYDSSSGELLKKNELKISAIKNELADSDQEWTITAYNGYSFFSKYEHISALTFDLQKIHLLDIDYDINGIVMALCYIFWGIEGVVKFMGEYEDLKSCLAELNEELQDI